LPKDRKDWQGLTRQSLRQPKSRIVRVEKFDPVVFLRSLRGRLGCASSKEKRRLQ
jgi:hypothetical protein